MIGLAYVFLRPNGAPLPAGDAGHVGWGFQMENGQLYAGSTENEGGRPIVLPGGDNGWWAGIFGVEADMIAAMVKRGYLCYKVAKVADCDPQKAQEVGDSCKSCGYEGLGNNCLDHVWRVLHAYNQPGLPWAQTHPTPNHWFSAYNGELHNI
jgi:hypothetical protein